MRASKFLLKSALLVVLALVVCAMLVPYTVIQYVLRNFESLRQLQDFLYTVAPSFEMDHLLAFGAVGFAAHFAWRARRAWQVALGCLVIAALIEFIQIWIPGRVAAVSHAVLDVVGGVAGFTLAWIFTYAWGSESTSGGYRHSVLRAGEDSAL